MKKLLITLISMIFVLGGISQAENYTSEQQEAYDYAYSQNITTMSSIAKANMNGQLTRIAMAKMISNFATNVLGLQPDTSKDCSFSDISNSLNVQYDYGVTQVCQLGLMGIGNDGKKSDKFNPYTIVTRAQFATAFSRALGQANGKIIDNGNPYYSTHLNYLHTEGIIKDLSIPDPSNVEKRGNVMIMMYRASNEVKNIGNKNDIKGNSEYYFKDLDITANIGLDGKVDVLEKFTAYFNVEKHGIIRSIPLKSINVSDINVKGYNFTTETENGNINIKIGDADRTIIGEHVYPISYSTYGLIRNFSGMGYSELYWNLVGDEFDTNINNVRAEIILPKPYTGLTSDDFLITTDGNSKTISGFDGTVDWSSGDKIIITYNKGLQAYHGITLAIKFPNNYFKFGSNLDSGNLGYVNQNEGNENDVVSYGNYIKLEKIKATKHTDLTIRINNESEGNIRITGIKLGNYKIDNSANVYFGDNTMDDVLKDRDDTATIKFSFPIDIKAGDSHTLTVRANIIGAKVMVDSISFKTEEDNFGKDYEVTKSDSSVADWENLFAEN